MYYGLKADQGAFMDLGILPRVETQKIFYTEPFVSSDNLISNGLALIKLSHYSTSNFFGSVAMTGQKTELFSGLGLL